VTPPPDDLQEVILAILSQALGHPLAPDQDFFAAGGDSLAAEQVLAALSAHLAQDVPGWVLLDYPTAQALAAALRG
jgi:hypothetical protein